ncbi:hypothetical protein EMN47_10020 [Prolixibacteraceae bacterium JC049]|nr:hypothetical protein [Prolixibacteraceae bacterium JC049]
MRNREMFKQIAETFSQLPANYVLLEEPVNIEVQNQYVDFVQKERVKVDEQEALANIPKLEKWDGTPEDLKMYLSQLAIIEKVEAYRALERFVKDTGHSLFDWAILALQESRMLLRSQFLDEHQVYVSSALGGRGQKLRYFLVMLHDRFDHFSEFEQKVFRNEMLSRLEDIDAEIEEVNFNHCFVTISLLLPIIANLEYTFNSGIDECNEYGNFLSEDLILTNMKKIPDEEIIEMVDELKDRLKQLPE